MRSEAIVSTFDQQASGYDRKRVESAAGAVSVGRGSRCCRRLSPCCRCLSLGRSSVSQPLIEPDLRISRIRLSDGLHERACTGLRDRRVW